MKVLMGLLLAALLLGLSNVAFADDAVCTNPQVASMKPTGAGTVEIVVKNTSDNAPSPKASLQLTYVNDNGTSSEGPRLVIGPIKPKGSTTLYARWPESASTINTKMSCSGS
ncbi:MAG TPA: hypothetical protein VKF82_08270 [Candidatus Eremiobacteraceae bacterium]|nr:hypothetical protein [Candidatus Eremiobacteraceae bacterium]